MTEVMNPNVINPHVDQSIVQHPCSMEQPSLPVTHWNKKGACSNVQQSAPTKRKFGLASNS